MQSSNHLILYHKEVSIPLMFLLCFILIFVSTFGYVMLQIGHIANLCTSILIFSIGVPIVFAIIVIGWGSSLIGIYIHLNSQFKTEGSQQQVKYVALGEGSQATSVGNENDDSDMVGEETIPAVSTVENTAPKDKLKPLVHCLNITFGIFALVTSLLLISSCLVLSYLRMQTHPRHGPLYLKGVKSSNGVRIDRENSGILHVIADNEHDLFFGQGVAQAQERLWQMDLVRRTGSGTLSEVLGSNSLFLDKQMRTLGLSHSAKADALNLKRETKEMLQAFVDGVNAYLETNPPLGIEFMLLGYGPEKWTISDVLLWLKVISWNLSANRNVEAYRQSMLSHGFTTQEIDNIYGKYQGPTVLEESDLRPDQKNQEHDPIHGNIMSNTIGAKILNTLGEDASIPFLGTSYKNDAQSIEESNNWVVGEKFTLSKKPIVAGDMHLAFSAPNIFLMIHLKSPGIDAIGAALPGCPGITVGHNHFVAWASTSAEADTQDFFILDEAEAGKKYRVNNQLKDYKVRNEIIKVKGQSDTTLAVLETEEFGPVFNRIKVGNTELPMALKWTGTMPNDHSAEAYICILKAHQYVKFRDCFKNFYNPPQNIVYGDVNGNIGYILPGYFPIREPSYSGMYPVKGDGSHNWNGRVPFDNLPSAFNPQRGYILSANNRPVPNNYRFNISSDWLTPPYRANRIKNLVQAIKGHTATIETMKKMQLDITSDMFLQYKFLFEEMGEITDNPNANDWRIRMARWNGEENIGSEEAFVWENYIIRLSSGISPKKDGNIFPVRRYTFSKLKAKATDCPEGNCVAQAKKIFSQLITDLTNTHGSYYPQWGRDVHKALFYHPVLQNSIIKCASCREVHTPGGTDTINVGSPGSNFDQSFGVTYRQIIDLGNLDNSVFITPLGQSGQFFSDYYDNMLHMWSRGNYFKMTTKDYSIRHSTILREKLF